MTQTQDHKTAEVWLTIPDCEPGWAVQDFLRNNRGINDGADLPEEYMCNLYNSIVSNEIKMKVKTLVGLRTDLEYILIQGRLYGRLIQRMNHAWLQHQGIFEHCALLELTRVCAIKQLPWRTKISTLTPCSTATCS